MTKDNFKNRQELTKGSESLNFLCFSKSKLCCESKISKMLI